MNHPNHQSEVELLKNYLPKNKIRIVTSTALFDGHDASINIMRRLLQARGAEVIHLGHTRSAQTIVQAVLQEDAQAGQLPRAVGRLAGDRRQPGPQAPRGIA